MNFTDNHPAIHLATSRFLGDCIAREELDSPSAKLVERALAKSLPKSVCGWVFLLATALGADTSRAIEAASFAELFYCSVDVIDDVQDGDASEYLRDLSEPLRVNVCMHLVALSVMRGIALEHEGSDLVRNAYGLLSSMICGQRMDLVRDEWSADAYACMSTRVAGCQLEVYFRAAACAANADITPFVSVAKPLGLLLQIAVDSLSRDPRLMHLPTDDLRPHRERAVRDVTDAMNAIPQSARSVMDRLARFAEAPMLR